MSSNGTTILTDNKIEDARGDTNILFRKQTKFLKSEIIPNPKRLIL